MQTLKISNLTAEVDGKQILNGINLTMNTGEIHALMDLMVRVKVLFQMLYQVIPVTQLQKELWSSTGKIFWR